MRKKLYSKKMNKPLLILFGFFSMCISSFGQAANKKILYIIDSIPILNDPESWNQILQEDIADYSVISNKDSLKLLGWEKMDGVAYIFTKEYRNRPDSMKRIPSLKQMVLKGGVWVLNKRPYSGRYVDYYNNGKIQNKGTLLNGKIDGELTVYYKTGIKKSITHYKDGTRHGLWIDYYQNGALMRMDEFIDGRANRNRKSYFINGQIMYEMKPKRATEYDTSISYYSTGKVRQMTITKTGAFHPSIKQANLNYHTTMFFENLRLGDIKQANKNFHQIWLLDSSGIDTYFKEGLLLSHEFRFDEAIAQFDKALAIEPLMREALQQRGLARVKKHKFKSEKLAPQDRKDIPLVLEDVAQLSDEEQAQVCHDFLLADELDPGVNYTNKAVPDAVLNYCKRVNSH